MRQNRFIIAILGPTASGKSAVALDLARRMPSEIVSCDSMQVYKELDIGVAKPGPAELHEIKHHLINERSIVERFDTNQFVLAARAACERIWNQNKTVILVGGTGLYAKSLLYDFELQPSDPVVFKEICQQAQTKAGLNALTAELRAAGYTETNHSNLLNNPRRIIRAVEILRLKEHSEGQGADLSPLNAQIIQFILLPPKDALRKQIFTRTAAMLNCGWVEETIALTKKGLFDTPTAYQALGYREIRQWIDEGNHTISALQSLLGTKTWQYARRQITWFRRQHPGAYLLTLKHDYSVPQIIGAIEACLSQ